MIGLLDTGYGGLCTLKVLRQFMPQTDFLYLADHAFFPYSTRGKTEIKILSDRLLSLLFKSGCQGVFVTCQTISATILTELQKTWIPAKFPGHWLIGTIDLMVDQIIREEWPVPYNNNFVAKKPAHVVGLFTTKPVAEEKIFTARLKALRPNYYTVFEQPCPRLAEAIYDEWTPQDIANGIKRYARSLRAKSGRTPIELAILGCSDYQLVADFFRENLEEGVFMPDPALLIKDAFLRVLEKHNIPYIGSGTTHFITTGDPEHAQKKAVAYYGEECPFISYQQQEENLKKPANSDNTQRQKKPGR